MVQHTNDNNMVPEVSGEVAQNQRFTAVVAGIFGDSDNPNERVPMFVMLLPRRTIGYTRSENVASAPLENLQVENVAGAPLDNSRSENRDGDPLTALETVQEEIAPQEILRNVTVSNLENANLGTQLEGASPPTLAPVLVREIPVPSGDSPDMMNTPGVDNSLGFEFYAGSEQSRSRSSRGSSGQVSPGQGYSRRDKIFT